MGHIKTDPELLHKTMLELADVAKRYVELACPPEPTVTITRSQLLRAISETARECDLFPVARIGKEFILPNGAAILARKLGLD